MTYTFSPIGTIHSPFKDKQDIPSDRNKRPDGYTDIQGQIEVHESYAEGLQDIEDFSHRPNAIGLTVVRLHERSGRLLKISGLDMLEGTPVLDIKPYTPRDLKSDARFGWLEDFIK